MNAIHQYVVYLMFVIPEKKQHCEFHQYPFFPLMETLIDSSSLLEMAFVHFFRMSLKMHKQNTYLCFINSLLIVFILFFLLHDWQTQSIVYT